MQFALRAVARTRNHVADLSLSIADEDWGKIKDPGRRIRKNGRQPKSLGIIKQQRAEPRQ